MKKFMTTKYYTPKIEEFHVGFVYIFASLGKKEVRIIEEEDLSSNYGKPDSVFTLFKEGFIKVKVLDKEDIEFLGFKHHKGGWYINSNPSGELGYWTMCSIREWGEEITIRGHRGQELDSMEQEILFQGVVKNVNELNKLLYQLKIKYDRH